MTTCGSRYRFEAHAAPLLTGDGDRDLRSRPGFVGAAQMYGSSIRWSTSWLSLAGDRGGAPAAAAAAASTRTEQRGGVQSARSEGQSRVRAGYQPIRQSFRGGLPHVAQSAPGSCLGRSSFTRLSADLTRVNLRNTVVGVLVRRGACLLGWLVALVIMPATATAATVFTREGDLDGELISWTVFEAAPGEANRVTAAAVADFSAARWVEAGAPLIVLPECSAAAGAAICPNSPVRAELGDRADVAQITLPNAPALLLNAGDGADDVFADFLLGNVSGEGGNDHIHLGQSPAFARVFGGPGRDIIRGGGGGRELFGGPGRDLIVFEAPVGLVQGDEGNDVLLLAHVEPSDNLAGADGGSGNDVLVVGRDEGPPDPPPFPGSRAWWLAGGDGNDVLSGGSGPDVFVGGAGADLLFARDGRPEEVGCGDGFDVAFVDRDDTVSGCELALRMSDANVVRARAVVKRAASQSTAPRSVRRALIDLVAGRSS